MLGALYEGLLLGLKWGVFTIIYMLGLGIGAGIFFTVIGEVSGKRKESGN